MNSTDLMRLIEQGEGPQLEFGTGHAASEMAARAVVAFLNQGGGQVILGVDAHGVAVGVPDGDALAAQIHARLATRVSPKASWAVEAVSLDGKNLVVVDVPEGADKPYVIEGAIYLRRGARTVAASRDEISALIQRRVVSSGRWERQTTLGAARRDLDDRLIRLTLQRALQAGRWQGRADDLDGFLHGLGLAAGDEVTHAALVLYGRKPARLLPQARTRLLVMPEGKTANRYEVDKMFDACLLQVAEDIPIALAAYAGGVSSEFAPANWQRTDRQRYPMTALREGVMNALVHRDYESTASIAISVLPDSFQISNPGGLPDELSVADLKRNHLSLPRNPDIAHVCFLHGLIEKLGRGTQRILEDCRAAHMKAPKWSSSALETSLTFYAAAAPVGAALNDRQLQILDVLGKQASAKAAELVGALGASVTERTIRTDLLQLIELGRVRRRGQGPSTSYALAEAGRPKS